MAETASKHPGNQIAKRLELCFDMFDFGAEMMLLKLRRDRPEASEAEIRARYVEWLHERPGAEHGDGEGRPATWPRNGS